MKRRWSRQLLEILAVGRAAGKTAPVPGLLVCNHVSWLDIYVINALAPTAFVAKDEVRDWPLIGWLCARTETIFLARGSRAAAQRTRETMIKKLRAGDHVGVFPEGTTSGGERVLPFHAALFQSAIDAGVPVIPLALRYLDRDGNPSQAPAYAGDITMWQSLRAIALADGVRADLRVLAPLSSATVARRELARHCHQTIAWHLGQGSTPRAIAASSDADADAHAEATADDALPIGH